MAKREFKLVSEILYWSYANLAMAHAAVDKSQSKYTVLSYMIRAKLYKGLKDGSMNIRSLFDDEKIKLHYGTKCNYCGCTNKLAIDHIFPKILGGEDTGDNLIYACKPCNSSKGKKDLMKWISDSGKFPPLMVLRRYLKLVISYCVENSLMDSQADELIGQSHPFDITQIPLSYPKPKYLELVVN